MIAGGDHSLIVQWLYLETDFRREVATSSSHIHCVPILNNDGADFAFNSALEENLHGKSKETKARIASQKTNSIPA